MEEQHTQERYLDFTGTTEQDLLGVMKMDWLIDF